MKKRILACFITVMMIFTLLPINAFASTVPTPQNLLWDTSVKGEIRAKWDNVDVGEDYAYYKVEVFKNGTSIGNSNNTNENYDENYSFSDLTEMIATNGSGNYTFSVVAICSRLESETATSGVYNYTEAANIINEVEIIEFDMPIAGEFPGNTSIAKDTSYDVSKVSWENVFDTFSYNTEYTAEITVIANENYRFDNVSSVKVLDIEGKIIEQNSLKLVFTISCPRTEANPNTEIFVNGENAALADVVCGDGKAFYSDKSNILTLENAEITIDDGIAAINSNRDIKINLVGNNTITITDDYIHAIKMSDSTSIIFMGTGSLTASSASDTIYCEGNVTMLDGTLTISTTGQYNCALNVSGSFNMQGGSLNLSSMSSYTFSCDGNITISGGKLTADIGVNEYPSCVSCLNYAQSGADTYVDITNLVCGNPQALEDGDFEISGGKLIFDTPIDETMCTIFAYGSSTVSGGEITSVGSIYTNSLSITNGKITINTEADTALISLAETEISGGEIIANGENSGAYLYGMNLSGGELTASGKNFGIMAMCGAEISGGIVNATAKTEFTAEQDGSPTAGVGILSACEGYNAETNTWNYTPDALAISGGNITANGGVAFWGNVILEKLSAFTVNVKTSKDGAAALWDGTTLLNNASYKSVAIVPDSQPTVIYGDANSDGKVNSQDVLALRKYNSGFSIAVDMKASDVTQDGKVNSMDILKIKRFNAGIITALS